MLEKTGHENDPRWVELLGWDFMTDSFSLDAVVHRNCGEAEEESQVTEYMRE